MHQNLSTESSDTVLGGGLETPHQTLNIPTPRASNTSIDHSDIFSTSRTPSPDLTGSLSPRPPTQEPSEIPRLRAQHNTSGYRDGIASSKSLHTQEGFDEGYSLGAVVGRKVGYILGVLGGIAVALRNKDEEHSMERLEKEAREELTVEEILGKRWWNWEAAGDEDVWRFEVGDTSTSAVTAEIHEEISWQQIVDAHPLIKKWSRCAEELVEEWTIDLHRFAREDVQSPQPATAS
jgi:hypothetical protein